MKYYMILGGIYLTLLSIDLFLSRLFMGVNISVAFSFLVTVAFSTPQKTRFIYRTLIPIIVVCGLIADSLSAVLPGVVFIGFVIFSIIVLGISRNIPSADNIWTLMLVVFGSTLLLHLIIGLIFNRFGVDVMVSLFLSSLISAFFNTLVAVGFVYLMVTSFGGSIGKIVFNNET